LSKKAFTIFSSAVYITIETVTMQILSQSVRHTANIGKTLAKVFKAGDIVCLYGDLGTGKTVFARGIGSGLGVKECGVVSPTFVLMRCHSGRIRMYHFDLYRIRGPREMLGLGYEEFFFSDGVCVIEWAERLGSLAPRECLKVELEHVDGNTRRLRFISQGKRYGELRAEFNRAYKKELVKKRAR
jgi:tRNA threonylcarbamoyladenosine biosynthesis protein TsaE